MPTNVWRGSAVATAQVDTATPADVQTDDIFTLTLTDDLGFSASVSYTAVGPTTAAVVTGLTAAVTESVNPLFQGVTAVDDTTEVTVTADTAGVPFNLSGSTTDGGGADIQTLTVVTTTTSTGPNDYGVPENWTLERIPEAGDDVCVPVGSSSILYGLGHGSVAIASFTVAEGYAGSIGRTENGSIFHLHIDPDALAIEGMGSLIAIDIGSAAIAPFIRHTGNPSAVGLDTVLLIGTAMTTVFVDSGWVGIAGHCGEISTLTGGINVSAGDVHIGPGVTVSGATVEQGGGVITSHVGFPTVNKYGGSFYQETVPWPDMNNFNGTAYPNAEGVYANTYSDDLIDNSINLHPKTFTDSEFHGSGSVSDPTNKITYTNPPARTGYRPPTTGFTT